MKDILKLKWIIVDEGYYLGVHRQEELRIYTEDMQEVVGCSEWMNTERSTFEHIVKLHNQSIGVE